MRRPSLRVGLLGLGVVAGAVAVLAVGQAEAEPAPVGTVTYLKGEASRAAKGANFAPLHEKAKVAQGDRLKTGPASRLEATLADGSKLRLGAGSELSLENLVVGKKREAKKRVTAKLLVGRVWASVTKLFGTDSNFEVKTENAVAGVRGTRFSATRSADGETSVRVYSGQVLVSNKPIYAVEGHTKGKRVEVAGPQEISKKQWEELVAGAMQVVRIAADGAMTAPEGFALADPAADDWEQWNSERDKLAGLSE